MIQSAEEVLQEHERFLHEKKDKARKVMKDNWDEQLRTRNNEEIVNRIFDWILIALNKNIIIILLFLTLFWLNK